VLGELQPEAGFAIIPARVPPTFIPLAAAGLGIEPILITPDLPGEIWLQPCLVVCRKRTAVR
jgi:hypothetical protein